MQDNLSLRVESALRGATCNSDGELLAAANELRELGISYRGGIDPRGTPETAAEPLLPAAVQLKLLLILCSKSGNVRNQLMLALSNWTDDSLLLVTESMLADPEIQKQTVYSCILALQTVGGPEAIFQLQQIIESYHSDEYIVRAARLAVQRVESGSYDVAFGPTKPNSRPPLPPLQIPSDLLSGFEVENS